MDSFYRNGSNDLPLIFPPDRKDYSEVPYHLVKYIKFGSFPPTEIPYMGQKALDFITKKSGPQIDYEINNFEAQSEEIKESLLFENELSEIERLAKKFKISELKKEIEDRIDRKAKSNLTSFKEERILEMKGIGGFCNPFLPGFSIIDGKRFFIMGNCGSVELYSDIKYLEWRLNYGYDPTFIERVQNATEMKIGSGKGPVRANIDVAKTLPKIEAKWSNISGIVNIYGTQIEITAIHKKKSMREDRPRNIYNTSIKAYDRINDVGTDIVNEIILNSRQIDTLMLYFFLFERNCHVGVCDIKGLSDGYIHSISIKEIIRLITEENKEISVCDIGEPKRVAVLGDLADVDNMEDYFKLMEIVLGDYFNIFKKIIIKSEIEWEGNSDFLCKGFLKGYRKLHGVRNWKSKRLVVDLSYFLESIGYKPLKGIDNNVPVSLYLLRELNGKNRLFQPCLVKPRNCLPMIDFKNKTSGEKKEEKKPTLTDYLNCLDEDKISEKIKEFSKLKKVELSKIWEKYPNLQSKTNIKLINNEMGKIVQALSAYKNIKRLSKFVLNEDMSVNIRAESSHMVDLDSLVESLKCNGVENAFKLINKVYNCDLNNLIRTRLEGAIEVITGNKGEETDSGKPSKKEEGGIDEPGVGSKQPNKNIRKEIKERVIEKELSSNNKGSRRRYKIPKTFENKISEMPAKRQKKEIVINKSNLLKNPVELGVDSLTISEKLKIESILNKLEFSKFITKIEQKIKNLDDYIQKEGYKLNPGIEFKLKKLHRSVGKYICLAKKENKDFKIDEIQKELSSLLYKVGLSRMKNSMVLNNTYYNHLSLKKIQRFIKSCCVYIGSQKDSAEEISSKIIGSLIKASDYNEDKEHGSIDCTVKNNIRRDKLKYICYKGGNDYIMRTNHHDLILNLFEEKVENIKKSNCSNLFLIEDLIDKIKGIANRGEKLEHDKLGFRRENDLFKFVREHGIKRVKIKGLY